MPEDSSPTQGTITAPRKRGPHNFAWFDKIVTKLQWWRSADHEDAIILHRNEVIELLEGIRSLRED